MIERISKNEDRFDKINNCVKKLEDDLKEFASLKKDLYLLNRYYGSNNWFKDKELYENNKIAKIKAGVLSEDAIWNLNDDIKDLMAIMKSLSNK